MWRASIDIQQLRYFLAVLDQGSYQRASISLGVTQSALTKSVARLEEQVGATLLHRGRHGATATATGGVFALRARAICAEMTAARAEVADLETGAHGHVRLGMGIAFANGLVPLAVQQFRQLYRRATVTIIEGMSPELFDELRAGHIDFVISSPFISPATMREEFEQEFLFSDADSIVAAQNHALATLRATCEMDEEGILRDVVHTVDAHWRPLDAFVRLHAGGRFQGSSWFRFTDDAIRCEAELSDQGRVSQSITVPERPRVFACHPLAADGWQASAHDPAGFIGAQPILSAHCSARADGGSGPLAGVNGKTIERIGAERVVVPAGEFDAEVYLIQPDRADWPPLTLWAHGDDRILVRLDWELLESTYVLTELSKR